MSPLPAQEVAKLLEGLPSGFLAAWTTRRGIRVLYENGRVFGRKAGAATIGRWSHLMTVPGDAGEWWALHRQHNGSRIVILAENV